MVVVVRVVVLGRIRVMVGWWEGVVVVVRVLVREVVAGMVVLVGMVGVTDMVMAV